MPAQRPRPSATSRVVTTVLHRPTATRRPGVPHPEVRRVLHVQQPARRFRAR